MNDSNEIMDRGGTEEDALLGGAVSGILETVFEKFSLSELEAMKMLPVSSLKDFLGNIAKSVVTNAGEEFSTELANTLFDTIFMGELSTYALTVQGYMSQGKSEADARLLANWDLLKRLGESALSGALMGVLFGSGASANGYYRSQLAAQGDARLLSGEMPTLKQLEAMGLSEAEARGAMVMLNLDQVDGTDRADNSRANINDMTEAEESPRKSSGLSNGVNWSKVQSADYNKNFKSITDDPRVASALETRAKWALNNRDNSDTEEIYAIDATTGNEIARITDQHYKGGVRRTNNFSMALSQYGNGEGVILLHNHPHSMPPSVADFNALVSSPKAIGVIAGHDGSIYVYSAPKKEIPVREYVIAIQKYKEFSEHTAQEKALEDLCQLYGFYFKRMVTE